jgi:dihydrofolate reductase
VFATAPGVVPDSVKHSAMPSRGPRAFGGGDLFRSLLDLGLVDTVEVAVIPVLLGRGIPLLPTPAGRSRLTLTSHRVFRKTGTLSLAYDVSRRAGGRRVPGIKT